MSEIGQRIDETGKDATPSQTAAPAPEADW